MASVQVLKKQEHLQAGKKKLEEFRRKKAAEKAKKAAVAGQLQASDNTQPPETSHVRYTDSNGVGNSDAHTEVRLEPSGGGADNSNEEFHIAASNDANATPSLLPSSNYLDSSVVEHSYLNNERYEGDTATMGLDGSRSADDQSSSQVVLVIGSDHSLAPQISPIQASDPASNHTGYVALHNDPSINTNGPETDPSIGISGSHVISSPNILSNNSVRELLQDTSSNVGRNNDSMSFTPYNESAHSIPDATDSVYGVGQNFSLFSDMAHSGSVNLSSPWTSDNRYANYSTDAPTSSNHEPAVGRRSRPSFLDSIQVPQDSSSSPLLFGEAKASSSSGAFPMDGLGSSVYQRSADSFVTSGAGVDLFNHIKENKHDFFSQKQNEDFAALEQHIEDLTQDKFSLQRALEASRALAENLASENSALTDSFNQQGSVVNQLKFELENLQEQLNAQLAELEAVRIEYANAQLECDAADQRAKLLASELIALEEKSLRVRSNELKLERQLESSQAEISSYRKNLSSLEKDRQDLQSTVDALKEEKKLLQSKLRKASSGSGKSINIDKILHPKKDVSTSTEDLEPSESDNTGTSSLGDDAPSSQIPDENLLLSFEGGLPSSVPSDQLRMIQNINTLLAELALEKGQLMEALSAESSQSSKLLELNKELTRKLEAQTQRLELLTAQSMANDNIQLRQPDLRTVTDNTPYADEGDEVVERVLGWIMKLFPGGPSRRRTGKHH